MGEVKVLKTKSHVKSIKRKMTNSKTIMYKRGEKWVTTPTPPQTKEKK